MEPEGDGLVDESRRFGFRVKGFLQHISGATTPIYAVSTVACPDDSPYVPVGAAQVHDMSYTF